jgi:tetratricopeptide (TPR) repeat protein
MKSKYVSLVMLLMVSVVAIAQKDQIKAAEKALKASKPEEAVTILTSAASIVSNTSDSEKAHFYFVKGKAHFELANKKVDEGQNLLAAAKSFKELLAIEKAAGSDKYTTEAKTSLINVKRNLLNSSVDDSKENRNSEAAQKIYDVYLLEKKDTINLYYAATTYVNAKEYAKALDCYLELKALNFSGIGTTYLAMNKDKKEEDTFGSVKERDLSIKFGTHEKPRTEKTGSKRGEIYKNIALILVDQGKIEDAKNAIKAARSTNPDDETLLMTEANLYLQTKDYETYKKLVNEALEKKPNDDNLVFNLGVLSSTAKNPVDAEKYYRRVLEINPKYVNAYINLAALKMENEGPIINEMNKLSTSAKDTKRYDILKVQRENLFKETIPILKTALELDQSNIDIAKTLMNVYNALEMTTEYKELKAKIKAQEAAK